MKSTIRKWGNSQAIALPKALVQEFNLSIGDSIEIDQDVSGQSIIIKINHPNTLERYLETYQNQSCSMP